MDEKDTNMKVLTIQKGGRSGWAVFRPTVDGNILVGAFSSVEEMVAWLILHLESDTKKD